MMDLDTFSIPASGMVSNIGLPEALRENGLDPRMVNHIDEIIQGVLDKDPAVTPDYIDLTKEVIVTDNRFNFSNAIAHRIYHVQCQPMRNLVLPAGILPGKIAPIADCQITIGANSTVYDSFIASRSGPTPGVNPV